MIKVFFSIAFVLLLNASFGQGQFGKFLPGVIYDNYGHKYVGYVAFAGKGLKGAGKPAHFQNAATDAILYKADSVSKADPTNVSTSAVRSFTILTDSFTILRNFKMFGLKSRVRVQRAIGQVVVGDGKVILYNCNFRNIDRYGPGSNDYNTHYLNGYLVQISGGDELIAVEEGINEFVPQMSMFLKDSEEIVTRVKNREYSYFKIEQLIRDYNALSKLSQSAAK